MQKQDDAVKAVFPPLTQVYESGSLGGRLQEEFKRQAENSCGIVRQKPNDNNQIRNYVPRDILDLYREENLRSIKVMPLNISATNILFFALKGDDVAKLRNGTFNENEYTPAKRVIGLKEKFLDYGSSLLDPIDGFPSYIFQKSCGSYFTGELGSNLTFPVAELQKSIKAEAEKSSMITVISGKFFSPLYLVLSEASKKSVYAHLLLWQAYVEDDKVTNLKQNILANKGFYVSEFDATLIQTSTDRSKNLELTSRLAAGISAGVFSANGEIKAGIGGKEKFSMSGFTTMIHLKNTSPSYQIIPLPSIQEINAKLQRSLDYPESGQRATQNNATHLLPFTLAGDMGGIPPAVCSQEWEIDNYDVSTWKEKPTVKTTSKILAGDLPNCFCEITGNLKQEAITAAANSNSSLRVEVGIASKASVGNAKLRFKISDPSVPVSKGPILVHIDENIINLTAKTEEGVSGTKSMNYKMSLIVDDVQIPIRSPLEIVEIKVEFANATEADSSQLIIEQGAIVGKKVDITLKTNPVSASYFKSGERNLPIKLIMRIKLQDGRNETRLTSNLINLKVPIFSEPSSK